MKTKNSKISERGEGEMFITDEEREAMVGDVYSYRAELVRQQTGLYNAACQPWQSKEERRRLEKEAEKIHKKLGRLLSYEKEVLSKKEL